MKQLTNKIRPPKIPLLLMKQANKGKNAYTVKKKRIKKIAALI